MAIPTSELQSINPSAIIELFSLELNTLLHGSNTIYRFHAGTNELNNNIVWQGDTYDKFPIQAEGFEFSGAGSLPRPTLTISNAFGFVSALIIDTNNVTAKNDLQGAKFTRRRVLASSLDDVNFVSGSNPFGNPNSNELPQEIYFIDRKITENRQLVQFECVSVLDLQGIKIPKRQITRRDFAGVGTFINS
jgi:lambda family phage minor tail protein L